MDKCSQMENLHFTCTNLSIFIYRVDQFLIIISGVGWVARWGEHSEWAIKTINLRILYFSKRDKRFEFLQYLHMLVNGNIYICSNLIFLQINTYFA